MLPVIRDTTQGLWGGGSKERGITSDLFFTTWIWECSTRSPNTGHSRLSHGAALWRVVTRSTPTLQFYSCFRNFCSPHLNPSVKSSHISKQTAINLLLYQIKGYFSFSIVVSPEGRISVIFSSIELLELSLSPRVTRGRSLAFHILKRQEIFLEDLGELSFRFYWASVIFVFPATACLSPPLKIQPVVRNSC